MKALFELDLCRSTEIFYTFLIYKDLYFIKIEKKNEKICKNSWESSFTGKSNFGVVNAR